MKFLTLNLLSLISGKELNDYQKKLAKQEYDKLINLVEELENKPSSFDDVMARLFDDVTKNSNADRSRVVAGFDKGKLCFYELDLHEETVKRYLTTVSLNVP